MSDTHSMPTVADHCQLQRVRTSFRLLEALSKWPNMILKQREFQTSRLFPDRNKIEIKNFNSSCNRPVNLPLRALLEGFLQANRT